MNACCFIAFIFIMVYSVNAQGDNMISLTFVIDETNSMNSEIRQVENRSLDVFESVRNSNRSNIKNFILVTFGDTTAVVRANTEDGNILKKELSNLRTVNGGDCPESAFKGIQKAAMESLPGSNIYVFTDAAPNDYSKFYEKVRELCHKKQLQIVFLLTGKCPRKRPEDNKYYSKYHEIAIATSGQVFNIKRNEINKIINYIKARATDRKSVLTCRNFGPGNHTIEFTVDDKIKDVVVSVTRANMILSGPGGEEVLTTDLVRLPNTTVVKITDAEPGVYTIHLTGEAMVTVTGTTNLFFTYGFLAIEVDTINNTATRPIAGEKTHLYIKLSTEDPVLLKTARILDIDENVIMEEPLRVIDKKINLYVTDLFLPPNSIFKVGIEGYDEKSKIVLRRMSPTPIESQKLPATIKKRSPVVILEISEMNVEYDSPVKLKCKITDGYPKPDIIWTDVDTKDVLPTDSFRVTPVELPYEYLSVLNIKKVNKNSTYECKASNSLGKSLALINIITKNSILFQLTCPKRSYTVPLYREVKLVCQPEANPPAKIVWYINSKVVKDDSNVYTSRDDTILTISRMNKKYRRHSIECRATHVLQNKSCITRLDISGKKPKLNKLISSITAMKGSSIDITCRVEEGDKPIKISFKFTAADSIEKIVPIHGETYDIKDVLDDDAGYYECLAENDLGRDKHGVYLNVEYPPSISIIVSEYLIIERGSELLVDCQIDGKPDPNVSWLKNTKLKMATNSFIGSYTFRDKDTYADATYTCVAENKHGVVRKTISVNVHDPVTIEAPKATPINTLVGSSVVLDCKADGYPKPTIKWQFRKNNSVKNVSSSETGSKKLQNLQIYQEGYYTCIATNKYDSKNITYKVTVNDPVKIISHPSTLEGIVGDPLLKIPCVARGRPKPTITWLKDGYYIASGTLKYNIEADGTLQIFNIDDGSTASYECRASNTVSKDKMTFKVIVRPYTYSKIKMSRIVLLEEGKSHNIECEASHKSTDSIRWYKNGLLISSTKLELREASTSHTGRYTCRVFKDGVKHTGDYSLWIKVGSKPRFKTKEELNIDLTPKTEAYLNCEAVGTPAPTVSWRHNEDALLLASTAYYITKDPGEFHCIVSNEFGAIKRTFTISTRECLLDITSDFNIRPPLILEPGSTKLPNFEICNDYMRIPAGRSVSLHCPPSAGFENIDKSVLSATCHRKTEFEVEGSIYSFSQLKCKESWKPIASAVKQPCVRLGNHKVTVGYVTRWGYMTVYEICYNKREKIPVFAEKQLNQITCSDAMVARSSVSSASARDGEWYSESLMPYMFDDMYSCTVQDSLNSRDYRRWFGSNRGRCTIGKRQLLNPRHLTGLPQGAAYSYLNVVPQLTQFMDNWDEVERRVELKRKEVPRLKMLSGALYHIPGGGRIDKTYIIDRGNRMLPVPLYLWKTIDVITIVQINIPNLNEAKLDRYIFCEDICHMYNWTKNIAWQNVANGYIFCCDQSNFFQTAGFS